MSKKKAFHTDDEFDDLAQDSIKYLRQYLNNGDRSPEAMWAARIASSVISSWTRHKATKGGIEATNYMIARELAENKEELRRYIALSVPDSPFTKKLPPRKVL